MSDLSCPAPGSSSDRDLLIGQLICEELSHLHDTARNKIAELITRFWYQFTDVGRDEVQQRLLRPLATAARQGQSPTQLHELCVEKLEEWRADRGRAA